jgi:hypothetical protein
MGSGEEDADGRGDGVIEVETWRAAEGVEDLGQGVAARPSVDDLLSKQWRDPEFLELCRGSGWLPNE